ncbi:uncharacterized protein RCO7_14221 [Rhynchosporium graminicola]|uniref:Uncharacterized protein n=1 Tax=Rhynchosporium graminicola TaxID=2792576 RepID=A0A1E1K0L3_9HELO|nr:uncharacterized protein RCO7_14221 [Rhynchosporium commune]
MSSNLLLTYHCNNHREEWVYRRIEHSEKKAAYCKPGKTTAKCGFLQDATQDMMQPATTFANNVFCSRYDHGYSAIIDYPHVSPSDVQKTTPNRRIK